MTFQEALEFFGSTQEMCKAFQITRQSVFAWKQSNKIPLLRQLQIKELQNAREIQSNGL